MVIVMMSLQFLLPAVINVAFELHTKDTKKLNLWVDIDHITMNINFIIRLIVDVDSALVPKNKVNNLNCTLYFQALCKFLKLLMPLL